MVDRGDGCFARAGLAGSELTRRRLLKTGAAVTAASSTLSMPYFFSRSAAQSEPMVFWEFYSQTDDGTADPTAQWFLDLETACRATSVMLDILSPDRPRNRLHGLGLPLG